MMWHHRDSDGVPPEVWPDVRKPLYDELLWQAHRVGARSVDRLRALHERFPDDLPGDTFESLRHLRAGGPPAAADAPGDRRRVPRFPKPYHRAFLAEPFGVADPRPGEILDWSWDGLRVLSDRPLGVGAILTVRPTDGADERPVVVEVRHCMSTIGGWVAGCRILRTA